MKEKIKKFLSDKLNLTLTIIQSIAIICLMFIWLSIIFNIGFLIFESVFFVIWGIKILIDTNKIKYRKEYYSKLPYTAEQLEYLKKKDVKDMKSGKLKGYLTIFLGISLLYMSICAII